MRLQFLAMALLATLATADARPGGFVQVADAQTPGGPFRVQVSIQRSLPAPSGADEQTGAMEAARRLIYESAGRDCALMSEAFKADCRLVSLNINSSIFDRDGNARPMINANGNATYELTPRGK